MLQDGVYIKGLYLQGAGWEQRSSTLKEAEPMQLVCAMPSIHFKPSEARKKSSKGRAGGGGGDGDARCLLRRNFIQVLTTAAAGCLCERVGVQGKGYI